MREGMEKLMEKDEKKKKTKTKDGLETCESVKTKQ